MTSGGLEAEGEESCFGLDGREWGERMRAAGLVGAGY